MSLLGSFIGAVGGMAGNALGGVASSALGQYYNKKNMAAQFDYKMRELRESPTNFRKGLEAAGYNPLLALPSSISSGGVSSSTPSTSLDLVSGAKEGALISAEVKKAKAEAQQVELTNQGIESQNKILKAEARNADSIANAKGVASELQAQRDYGEFSALGGQLPTIVTVGSEHHPYDNPRFKRYVDKLLNEIDTSAYKSSKYRAYVDDALNVADRVTDLHPIKGGIKNVGKRMFNGKSNK